MVLLEILLPSQKNAVVVKDVGKFNKHTVALV